MSQQFSVSHPFSWRIGFVFSGPTDIQQFSLLNNAQQVLYTVSFGPGQVPAIIVQGFDPTTGVPIGVPLLFAGPLPLNQLITFDFCYASDPLNPLMRVFQSSLTGSNRTLITEFSLSLPSIVTPSSNHVRYFELPNTNFLFDIGTSTQPACLLIPIDPLPIVPVGGNGSGNGSCSCSCSCGC